MPLQPARPIVALIVAAAFFMENLDGTVIATALPQMAHSFGVPAVALGAGVSAYLLALAVFIPVSGWVADRLGTRTVFGAAMAVFTLASVLCGLSTGVRGFVAARLLQGAGGAMMVPVGRLVVLRTTPKAGLMHAFALLTWPALVAPVLGPPVGGFITTYASWRWIFLLNVPLGLAGLALIARFVPQLRAERRRPFDAVGFGLGAVSLGAVMQGLDMLGRAGEGTPGTALAVLAGGLAVGTAAVAHARRAEHPMLELAALRVPTFRVATGAGSLFRLAIGTAPFLLPLLFQLGFGLSAFASGLLVLATFAGNLAMKPLTTPVLRRYGFRVVLLANGAISALATLACCALVPATPVPLVAVVLFAGGLSRSMQFTALNTLAFADVPPERMSGASSLASMVQQLAAGLAVAASEAGLRLAAVLTGHAGPPGVTEFHLCFAMVAGVTLLGLPGAARLARDAGSEVSGRK